MDDFTLLVKAAVPKDDSHFNFDRNALKVLYEQHFEELIRDQGREEQADDAERAEEDINPRVVEVHFGSYNPNRAEIMEEIIELRN